MENVLAGVARFERCRFDDATIVHFRSETMEFVDCRFGGTLTNVIFHKRSHLPALKDLPPNEYQGSDFTGARLRDVAFRGGIDLTQQVLPSGPEYLFLPDGQEAIRRARARLASLAGDALMAAERHLEFLQMDVDAGQTQLFLIRSDFVSASGFFEILANS